MDNRTVIVHFDGSCTDTAKDGYMGTGIHAYYEGDEDKTSIFKMSKYTGIGTNNESEYISIIYALVELINRKLHKGKVIIKGDSQLVVHQLNNDFRARTFNMFKYRNKAQELMERFSDLTIINIPREQNSLADQLAKESTKGKRNLDYYHYRF